MRFVLLYLNYVFYQDVLIKKSLQSTDFPCLNMLNRIVFLDYRIYKWTMDSY